MGQHIQKMTCRHCGAIYQRAHLEQGERAQCLRCDAVLESYGVFSPSAWLAVLVTAVIAFALANSFPIATLFFQGSGQSASFMDAVVMTWASGYEEVAVMTFLVGFMLPVCHVSLLIWILGAFAFGKLPLFFETAVAWVDHLKPWCMIPVLLMGVLVAIVKLVGLASLEPGIGLFATAVTAVLLTAISRLDGHKIRLMAYDLNLSQEQMPALKPPSPALISRTWALILAAMLLYIPANLLPIMKITTLGSPSAHTIVGGVIELWQMGSWDIAVVVFIASVLVPSFKLVALSWLVYMTQSRSGSQLRKRTHLYGAVEFIGQWSMLDIFVVILLTALGHFGALLDIEPGAGAACFGAVVVLTMVAAMGFDPRLPWRMAGHRKHLRTPQAEQTHS